MAYFKDLSVYTYGGNDRPRPLENNVGWLDSGHLFPTAMPSEILLDQIWKVCKIRVRQMRGVHMCNLCPRSDSHTASLESHFFARNKEKLLLGSAEIRTFSRRGAIFAAPNLIYHYISAHHYRPPEEFVESLTEGLCPPDPQYFAELEKLGHNWHQL